MVETQAWQLRRCLSFLNNRVINRPHKPRDQIILNLLKDLGIEWPDVEGGGRTRLNKKKRLRQNPKRSVRSQKLRR